MKISMKLGRVGMNMQSATISKWCKQPGETFTKGEPLYEMETEKVTQEVEATGDGTLVEIRAPVGSEPQVGDVVCVVDMKMGS